MELQIRFLMVVLVALPLLIGYAGETPKKKLNPCLHGITVEEEAEWANGGINYRLGDGLYCKTPLTLAHGDHQSRYGGTFYMAPNGIHHLELLYSEQCGAQVVLYNAYTQELHAAKQLQGMVRVIPDDEEQPERMRFMQASEDELLLETDIGGIKRPFELQFHLQFPYRMDPNQFSLYVP